MRYVFRAVSIVWMVAVVSLPIVAQADRHESKTPTTKLAVAAASCHAKLASLEGKAYGDFDRKSVLELQTLLDSIDECVRNWYSDLPKFDLVLATVVTGWLQSAIDAQSVLCAESSTHSGPSVSSQEPARSTLASQPAAEVPAQTYKQYVKSGRLKVSPLEIGSSFQFVVGNTSEACEVQTTETLYCTSAAGPAKWFRGALVTQQGRRYLIGCVQYDDTCLRPEYGLQAAEVEGKTVTFTSYQLVTSDQKTGRKIDTRPALFTILEDLGQE